MITITDTDNKPLSSLRLRPAQQATIRLLTESATPLIASLQATRADFLLTPLAGEAESVSRGNGQELLDEGLIEALLGGVWVPLSNLVEVGVISYSEPIDVTLRVKNVGQAVGEVAFGLAAVSLSYDKLMTPASQVLTVSGYEGIFLKLEGLNAWVHFPSNYQPGVVAGEIEGYTDVDFVQYYEGETELGSYVDEVKTIIAQGLVPTGEGYLSAKLTGGYNVRKGSIPLQIPLTADLTMIMVSEIIMKIPLYAAAGEDYTHISAAVDDGGGDVFLLLRYEDGAWELCEAYYDEEEGDIVEVVFRYETEDNAAVPAVFGDNGVYFFKKE